MKTVLFVDACIRGEDSRTRRLALHLANALVEQDAKLETVSLSTLSLAPLDREGLRQRDALSEKGAFEHASFDLARQFKRADAVLIAAPFWDLSFPSLLRVYLERLCVCGLTFHYDEGGHIVGDCAARRMAYVTTRGGYVDQSDPAAQDFAQPYLRSLCAMLGIAKFDGIAAEGLDIQGKDPAAILAQAEEAADALAKVFWNTKP